MGGTLGGSQVAAMLKALAFMAPATLAACPDGCSFLFFQLCRVGIKGVRMGNQVEKQFDSVL